MAWQRLAFIYPLVCSGRAFFQSLAVIAFASPLYFSSALAKPLTPDEEFFVSAATISTILVGFCPNTWLVTGGLDRLGDKKGIETEKFRDAIYAATNVVTGNSYKRENLIPEVTQLFNRLDKEMGERLRSDKASMCKELGEGLATIGVIRLQ